MTPAPHASLAQAPLEPGFAAFLLQAANSGMPPIQTLSPDQARQMYRQLSAELSQDPPAVASVRDLGIPGPADTLTLRAYSPPSPGPWPTLLYVHGGGFLMGDLETHDAVCRTLCQMADTLVVAVDYRLAPEHPFPAAPDDVVAAARWLLTHAGSLGGRPGPLSLAGDSAGAQLALVAARRLQGQGIGALGLFYPVAAHPDTLSASQHEHGHGKFLTRAAMDWFNQAYLGSDPAHRGHPEVDLLGATGFEGLPPTWLATLGHDPLCDEGVALAGRLRQAGVPVRHQHYPGAIHACLHFTRLSPTGWQLMADLAQWLRERQDTKG
ncbi:MAG: alpha/beta hydrolase [Curvibacter sp.]|nr:MAG: alpha/beta hydrolase [Curvibacter sp.]